jgi:DNA-binding transcriptional LysR family regulator
LETALFVKTAMADMQFSQLKYFKILAEVENLTRASEKLYISAPALSAALNKLEREMGAALFDRAAGKPLTLNKRGKVLLGACEEIFALLDSAVQEIKEMDDCAANNLNIGISSPMILQDCLMAFQKSFARISLSHAFLDLRQLQNSDIVQQYDFIIAAPHDIPERILAQMHYEYLYRNDYPMLLVYPEHPFAKRESVDMPELENEAFIALNKHLSSRKMFDDIFALAGFKPKIVLEVDYYARDRVILEGQGIGISTYQVKLSNTKSKLVFVHLKNHKFTRQQLICRHKRHARSVVAEEFRKFATGYYRQIDLPDNAR